MGGGRRTEGLGQKSVVGGEKAVVGRFTDYEPEAVMKKFREVFLK